MSASSGRSRWGLLQIIWKSCVFSGPDHPITHPDNCWKSKAKIVEIKQSRLLQCCDENFPIQMPKEMMKGDALINFTLSKELVRIVRVLAATTEDGGLQNIHWRMTNSRISNLNVGWVDLACSAWVNGMECDHGENKAAGELVNFQGISPLGSTVVYPDKKEVRQNVAGDLHGWTKSSWANSIHKKEMMAEVGMRSSDPGWM